jgi:hypothetical protein
MGAPGRTVEEIIGWTASRQHGVVTRAQLLAAGTSHREIARRLEKGLLIRVHRGVYRVGHSARSTEADYLAAVYAGGEGALLSGRAAARLLGLIRGAPPVPEITCPTQRRIRGVVVHRSRNAAPLDRIVRDRIPMTSVPRTLVDIAAGLAEDDLARACHEAEVRYRTTPAHVEAVLRRRPTAPDARTLRRVLRGDAQVALSKLERRFLELLRKNGLPLPVSNRLASGRRVDCRWPEHRLTVELDGYRYHSSRHAWEQDRRREREAHARGDDFRRFTYGDVIEFPEQMLGELRVLLLSHSG